MVRRPRSSRSKPLCFSIILISFLSCLGCTDKEPPRGPVLFKTDQAAPDFELTGLDTKTYHLSDFKGQVVVLNFWATWCGPCVMEMPSLERLHKALSSKGLRVVAINMDAPAADEAVKRFSRSYGLSFDVLRDPYYKAADKYGVSGFPETFIIGRDGKFISFKDPSSRSQDIRIISDRPWDSVNYLKEFESLL